MELIKNLKQFFINLWKWRKILWNDRDWDYAYVLDVLEFKLIDLRNGLIKWNNSARNPKSVEEINRILALLKAYKNEDFNCEYQQYIKEEIEWVSIKESPNLQKLQFKVIEDNSIIYLAEHKAMLRCMNRDIKNKTFYANEDYNETNRRLAFYLSKYRQERAKKLLWKMLEYKLENWWD